ncbi:hypothetical protein [Clavibacter michiganensis]|uniref:hypothetical protein n=1 Tax=Clavibacter michiganensis TaxID=28447 RepID=UPI0011B016B5|nr:hypothetical protein [Clavibacter michiganensis]
MPEYRLEQLPATGTVKKNAYTEAFNEQVNAVAAEGWEVVTINRAGSLLMPMDVLFRRIDS